MNYLLTMDMDMSQTALPQTSVQSNQVASQFASTQQNEHRSSFQYNLGNNADHSIAQPSHFAVNNNKF